MKEFEVILPNLELSSREFFNLFFSDSSSFAKDFHVARGDKEINIGLWTDDKNSKKRREIKFRSPTSTSPIIKKLAGETVSVTETQYYYFAAEVLTVETETKVEGSMSESFGTSAKWIIAPCGTKEITCKILVSNEYKGSWFKATVEDFIQASSVAAFDKYKEIIGEYIRNYQQKKKVQSPKPELSLTRASKILSDSETDTDEEYFDTENELVPQVPEISKFIQDISRELGKLRSVVESSETRLLAVEAAFLNLQEKYIPSINTKSKSFHENLIQYFKRVDELSRQLEEEKKARENEKFLASRMEQMASKLSRSSVTWTVTVALLFVAWPVFTNQAWKLMKSYWTKHNA